MKCRGRVKERSKGREIERLAHRQTDRHRQGED